MKEFKDRNLQAAILIRIDDMDTGASLGSRSIRVDVPGSASINDAVDKAILSAPNVEEWQRY